MTPRLHNKQTTGNGGFSLMELTAALFVLSVGLLGAIQMYHVGVDKTRVLGEKAIAAAAIQNELETLRAAPFSALTNTEEGTFRSETPGLARLVNATGRVMIADEDCPGLKRVTVSIRWTGEHGRTIEQSVTTLIADDGR